ncbi:hypothetical protein ABIB27_003838 [Arthrobacter sp. UYEF21]
MIEARIPDARSPGPSGPAEFPPSGGKRRSAERASALMCSSCQWISSSTVWGRPGVASPAAFTAYAAAPRRARPCERRLRLVWQSGRQPPQQGYSPRLRHGQQQTAGGSLRRHCAHRERRLGLGRWRRGGDHLPEPVPQIRPGLAQRSLRPKSRRRGARPRLASAEKPYQYRTHDSQTDPRLLDDQCASPLELIAPPW